MSRLHPFPVISVTADQRVRHKRGGYALYWARQPRYGGPFTWLSPARAADRERRLARRAEVTTEARLNVSTLAGREAPPRDCDSLRRELDAEKAARVRLKQWLDDVAGALHGWPEDAHKTYVPDQLAARARRLFEAQKKPA